MTRQAYNNIIYDSEAATLVAHEFSDTGQSRSLYRTPKGAYFLYTSSFLNISGSLKIKPLSEAEAIQEFNTLPDRAMDFAEAFPNSDFIEA